MHGKLIKLEEKELDQLILSEFDRVEKASLRKGPLRKEGKEEVVRVDQLGTTQRLTKKDETLTVDEEEFVSDTVEWLRASPNRDAIVTTILERLAETDIKSFPGLGDEEVAEESLPPESDTN